MPHLVQQECIGEVARQALEKLEKVSQYLAGQVKHRLADRLLLPYELQQLIEHSILNHLRH